MTIDPRAELDASPPVHAPPSFSGFRLRVLLMVAPLRGGPLAAKLTGHSPVAQYPSALHPSGLPIGFMSRTLTPAGTPNPHGSLFILGADQLRRAQLVRVLYGARISLLVAT